MQSDRVCIAGITSNGRCIRPVLPPPGVRRAHLFHKDRVIIFPSSEVEFDLRPAHVRKPHVEDKQFDPSSIRYVRRLTTSEWKRFLEGNSVGTVSEIYDGLLQEGKYVLPGADTRSLGTVIPSEVCSTLIEIRDGKIKYRIHFSDDSGVRYERIPVTDITFRLYWNAQIGNQISFNRIKRVEREIDDVLHSSHTLILRLGLARPLANIQWEGKRCYLQITGVYTFPDYLQGQTFADFMT